MYDIILNLYESSPLLELFGLTVHIVDTTLFCDGHWASPHSRYENSDDMWTSPHWPGGSLFCRDLTCEPFNNWLTNHTLYAASNVYFILSDIDIEDLSPCIWIFQSLPWTFDSTKINSLPHWEKYGSNCTGVFSNSVVSWIDTLSASRGIGFRWAPQDSVYDKSAVVQVMV